MICPETRQARVKGSSHSRLTVVLPRPLETKSSILASTSVETTTQEVIGSPSGSMPSSTTALATVAPSALSLFGSTVEMMVLAAFFLIDIFTSPAPIRDQCPRGRL
jgi:hypothetical protein